MLLCGGCDPDIVFRNRTAFFAEQIFDLAVMLCSRGIANQDSIRGGELIDRLNVRFDAARFARAVIQLSKNDAGHKDISCFCETLMNPRIFGENRDNDVRVEEKPTTY